MQKRTSSKKSPNAKWARAKSMKSLAKRVPEPLVNILRLSDGKDYAVVPLDEYQHMIARQMAVEARKELDDPNTEWFDADEVFAHFAATNVAQVRKAKGLTQKQLGDILGVPQSQISRIERNPDSASMRTMKRVAKALGVNVQDLL